MTGDPRTMNEALEWIERHAIEQGLTPAQVRDRFLAGEMAARVLLAKPRTFPLQGRAAVSSSRS